MGKGKRGGVEVRGMGFREEERRGDGLNSVERMEGIREGGEVG